MKLLCRIVRRRRGSVASLSALAVFLIGSLADAAVAQAADEAAGGGGGLFDVNWLGLMFWTWLIFILLFLVLRKWAWGPILGALEAREKRIQETLDGAARDREQAQRLLEQQQSLLDESRDQAQQILAESRKAGDRMRAELLEEARKQKDEIVARAKVEIDRERDQALETLRREAVDLSISAAGRVLEKNLDTRENRRLVEEYLAGLAAEQRGEKAD